MNHVCIRPASNVKLVSVHVGPVYASSVSELVKPLNVSKPLCSSKVSNRNVCNTSSVGKLIKPLNASKTVCSNTTRCNVCKVSSFSQLVKPSTVSKPVLSNNVRNVVNSINQCNSVICNSTCKPVSSLLVIVSQLNLVVNLLI